MNLNRHQVVSLSYQELEPTRNSTNNKCSSKVIFMSELMEHMIILTAVIKLCNVGYGS